MKHRILLATIIYVSVMGSVFAIHKANSDLAEAQANTATSLARNDAVIAVADEFSTSTALSGEAISVYVPRIDRLLDVSVGVYNPANQEWTLSEKGTHRFEGSRQPNNTMGMTFIYGHNTPDVLGGIENLQDGDIIEVTTDNRLIFAYEYVAEELVDPADTRVLHDHTGSPTLTLLSCAGDWNQFRRAAYFEYVSVREL